MKLLDRIFLNLLFILVFSQLGAQTIVRSDCFVTDFEDTSEYNNWVLNSGSKGKNAPNRWFFGAGGANSGQAGLFVSGDGGVTANYVASPVSVVSYRALTLEEGDYEISFDWQAGGMFGLDGLYVCWVPESMEGELMSVQSSFVQEFALDPEYSLNFGADSLGLGQRTWNTVMDTIHSDGTKHFLVVVWKNSVSGISAPAACIDNIYINKVGLCYKPSNLRISLKGDDVLFQWDGSAESYDVKCRNLDSDEWIEYTGIKDKYIEIKGLSEGIGNFYVRSNCGEFYSPWVSIDKFLSIVGNRCINYLNLTKQNCFIGTTAKPRLEAKVVDFGYLAKESRHTIHWNKNELDPRTEGMLRTVPDGAIASVRLGNWDVGMESESIEYDYLVDTATSAILILNYAVVLQDPAHEFADQPKFILEILYDGAPLDEYGCGEAYFTAGENTAGDGWHTFEGEGGLICWKEWTTIAINLRDYHGKSLKVRLQTVDCNHGAHFGYAYFTLECSDGKLKGLTCGDSPTYEYAAPEGFNYRWYLASDPDSTWSEDQVFPIAANDTATYSVDVIQPTNAQCYYTLSAVAEKRWPHVSATATIIGGCQNQIAFQNKSYVKTVNPSTLDTVATSQQCETFIWDFDDGTTSYDENPIHTFPEEGGTYNVRFTAGISGGACSEDTVFTFVFPKVGTTRDTMDAIVCAGESYLFNGRHYFGSGIYSDTLISMYGCDSILTLNLTVLPKQDDVMLEDEYICSDEVFIFNGDTITESGTYTATYEDINGCDSVVKVRVYVQQALHLSFDSLYVACADDERIVIPYNVNSGSLDTCNVVISSVNLTYDTISNVLVEDNILYIPMPDSIEPNLYTINLGFGPQACGQTGATTNVNIYYSREVLVQRWNDVLAVKNENYNGGGYQFVSFQWYKNGDPILGATSSILYEADGLDLTADYSVLLTRLSDNVTMMSCAADLKDLSTTINSTYIVVSEEQMIDIEATQNAKLNIWSTMGVKVAEYDIFNGSNTINLNNLAGVYIFEFVGENNCHEVQQVVLGK